MILSNKSSDNIVFHVRKRAINTKPRPPPPTQAQQVVHNNYPDNVSCLVELNPDGTEVLGRQAKVHLLHPGVIEIGSDPSSVSHGQRIMVLITAFFVVNNNNNLFCRSS